MTPQRFGDLSLDLPDGWRLTDRGDVLEIEAEGGKGTMHVSTYRRAESGDVGPDEAAGLLGRFIEQGGHTPRPHPTTDEGVAAASFDVEPDGTGGSEGALVGHVVVRLERRRAILTTFHSADGETPPDAVLWSALLSVRSDDDGAPGGA